MTSKEPSGERDRAAESARRWSIVGKVLAITVAIVGLVAIGAAILFVVAMNSWADNK